MDRIRTPFRRARHALAPVTVALLLAACPPIENATTFEGTLLDADGAAVANAVVYVADDTAASASTVGGAHFHLDGSEGCQDPTEAFVVRACTDAQGRFALSLPSPAPATVRLVFESSYWRTVLEAQPMVRGGRLDVAPRFPALEADEELDRALAYALPWLRDYTLLTLNDEKAIVDLTAHAATPDGATTPYYLPLPIRQPDGTVEYISWTAYHHDLRSEGVADCALDADTGAAVDCLEVEGPSLTFQGVPVLEPADYEARMVDSDGNRETLQNELLYQVSVVSVVGDELDATYHGLVLDDPRTPSSLQGLRSLLDVRYDPATTERLLGLTPDNTYLLFNEIDVVLDPEDEDLDLHVQAADAGRAEGVVAPASHFLEDGVKTLRPVMIADSTIYDAVAGEWLITDFRARVDAMANRQALIFAVLQADSTQAPANLTSLTQWSNAFAVRTRIGGYRRFTERGQNRFSWPANACVDSPSLLEEYRSLSGDVMGIDNEYWVWWTRTNRYSGTAGCAGVGGFGSTPRNGGAAWVSMRNASNQVVGSTLMHETGHLLNARHADGRNPHQCRLFGILPVGPNGPSLMITGVDRATRTQCFAVTLENATSLRSRTKVAEHLHANLD